MIADKAHPENAPARTKSCCADLYASEWVSLLLGDSFHPGGLALTERLGTLLGLTVESRVLDIAAGRGTSAICLARRFGCSVVGIDYSASNVELARKAAELADVDSQVHFMVGDAEHLAFADGVFDAVICECAFCLFPDKRAAAGEFARVLRGGGRLGLSDVTRSGRLPGELEGFLAWAACIADAQPIEHYVAQLQAADFTIDHIEAHDDALLDLVQSVQTKLLGVELLAKLKRLDLPGVDVGQALTIARAAGEALSKGKLGYAAVTAIKGTG